MKRIMIYDPSPLGERVEMPCKCVGGGKKYTRLQAFHPETGREYNELFDPATGKARGWQTLWYEWREEG